MHDVGKRVEDAPQAMAAEIAHHGAAFLLLGEGLDGVTDIAGGGAGLHHGDAAHHGFIGDLDQALGFALHLADVIHAAGIAMPAVQDDRHVDIDDVALLERTVAGDAVADDVIDRGAERMAVAAIAEARGQGAVIERVFEGKSVERRRGHARLHFGNQKVQHLRRQPAGPAHALEILRPVRRHREGGTPRHFDGIAVEDHIGGEIGTGFGHLGSFLAPRGWVGPRGF